MSTENTRLLTIFTETALESRLIKELEELGAPGYTITNARGKGSRGVRDASWEANSNIRIEIICNEETSVKLVDFLQNTYYENYAMVTFTSAIEVLRPNKFTS